MLAVALAGEIGEDGAAPLALAQQQFCIRGMGRVRGQVARQLPGDDGDGGEGRAQLMGGGGGKAAHRRDVLLAREGQLGRGVGIAHLARFLGDRPGIERNERSRAQQRGPDAKHVERLRLEHDAAARGQRHVEDGKHADRGHGERRKPDHRPARQDGGGYRHRRQQQHREGILQPAGQQQENAELQRVVSEIERRLAIAEPRPGMARQGRGDVEDRRGRHDGECALQRQVEAERVMRDEQRRRLAAHRHPADQHQHAQADRNVGSRLGLRCLGCGRQAYPRSPARL